MALGLIVAVFLSAAMTFAWRVAVRTGQSGFVDATWSLAVGLACILAALWPLHAGEFVPRRWLIAAFAALWAGRLALYIYQRSLTHGEDPRYAALKEEWGPRANVELFKFLQIQAVAGWPFAAAAALAAHAPFDGFRLQDGLATLVFAVAFVGETVADRQMAAFRANPENRGGVCEVGLWGWSRHPNYFFEWLGWCAYPIAAIDLSGGYWPGWISLLAPAMMYGLLVHVSGVPPLEAYMERTRPEAFARYKRRVPIFFPMPPTAGKLGAS